MLSASLTYQGSSIQYYCWQGGPEQLIFFHGYGENALSFESLAAQLQHCYTTIAINLPWHGETDWKGGLEFEIRDLIAIIDLIPGIQQRYSLAGYSMGGRVALQLYEHLYSRINKLILIAPDGLKVNGWYWLATQSRTGNRLFHHFMKKPGFFFAVTGVLQKLGLINKGVFNFTRKFLLQEKSRLDLYRIWTTMRKFKPAIPLVSRLLKQEGTRVILIYGQFDKIIRTKTGRRFAARVGKNISLHVLPTGHKLLQGNNAEKIAALIEADA